jgi:hypothetical protein
LNDDGIKNQKTSLNFGFGKGVLPPTSNTPPASIINWLSCISRLSLHDPQILNVSLVSVFNMDLRSTDYIKAIGWYCAFGIAHECIHLTAAILLGVIGYQHAMANWKSMVIDVIFHRQVIIPCLGSEICFGDWRLFLIRHAGWLSSLLFAIIIRNYRNKNAKKLDECIFFGSQWCTIAAILTAMDAIATDLFGMDKLQVSFLVPTTYIPTTKLDSITLHCGNFGVILLNGAWFGNGGKSALDILEKMIQVTMMRGAQSGKFIRPTDYITILYIDISDRNYFGFS